MYSLEQNDIEAMGSFLNKNSVAVVFVVEVWLRIRSIFVDTMAQVFERMDGNIT